MALDWCSLAEGATRPRWSIGTSAGSVLMFLRYTIHSQSASAMLIDEAARVIGPAPRRDAAGHGALDRADVEALGSEQIRGIIRTLSPGR
jgi:hypothetical protein